MAEDGQLDSFAHGAEPSVAELMDPIALEARLREARARRAEALARRGAEPADQPRSERPRGGAPTTPFAPKIPAWLEEMNRAPEPSPERAPPEVPAPAPRVRPVLVGTHGSPAAPSRNPPTTIPGDRPPLLAPAAPDDDLAPRLATRAEPRRRLPRAALLFVAGLGIGAAVVAFAVRSPAPDPDPRAVAEVASPPTSQAPAGIAAQSPAPAAPEAGQLPAVATTLPAAPDLTVPTPGAADIAEGAAPARLAAPASEPAPPAMAPPGPAIGDVIAAIAPPARHDESAGATGAGATEAGATGGGATLAVRAPLPERVAIHYPRSAQALAETVQRTLRDAGVPDVETMPVGFAIGKSNVRFYHSADQAGAEGASALLAGVMDGAPQTRDFTDYPTPTLSGRVEIWLAGEPGAGASSRQAQASTPRSTPAPAAQRVPVDPYVPVVPGDDQVRAVQRILLDRLQGQTP